MPATAEVALNTARALINDVSQQVSNDTTLIPYLQQAFNELQAEARSNAVSVMRKITTGTLAPSTTSIVVADIKEPIRLWEKLSGSAISTYTIVTEFDPLPNNIAPGPTLARWQWGGDQINLIGSTNAIDYFLNYWCTLPTPTTGASPLYFIDAEVYLAPRTAALFVAALGAKESYDNLTEIAVQTIERVMQANRGRREMTSPVPTVR